MINKIYVSKVGTAISTTTEMSGNLVQPTLSNTDMGVADRRHRADISTHFILKTDD